MPIRTLSLIVQPCTAVVADDEGELGLDVAHREILDVRVPADADEVLIAAHERHRPDARPLADLDLADDLRGRIHVRAGMDDRLASAVLDLADHRDMPPLRGRRHLIIRECRCAGGCSSSC
jgi:hypothetical protein